MHLKIEDTRLSTLLNSVVVGGLIGLIVSIFRLTIEKLLIFFQQLYQNFSTDWQWIVLLNLILAVGVGFLVKTTPDISGSGIPQIEGQLSGEYEEQWWPVLWKKFVGGILAIGAGLMLGREGPSIQLGAAVGQGWSETLRYRGSQRRVLIAGGAAAGLSAAFNAPIASTLFVLEEIYHNFSTLVWISALTSAVVANFISLTFFGLTPVLAIVYPHALPLNSYWHLLVLGILLGLFGRLYQICTLKLKTWYGKIKFLPRWLDSLVPFILIIPVGWGWPAYLGGGNTLITTIAAQNPVFVTLLILLGIRFVFSMVSYGSGLPGGIFLPILTLGAVSGALYVSIMAHWGLQHLMPLAVVALVAYIVLDLLGGEPIYESLLHQLVPDILAEPQGRQERVEVFVKEGSQFDGAAVRNAQWPAHSLLISIQRGPRAIVPSGDTVIKAGDTLVVTLQHGNRKYVEEYIKQRAE